MIAVTLKLGFDLSNSWQSVILMALSIIVAFKFPKISAFYVVIGGALLGYGLMLLPV